MFRGSEASDTEGTTLVPSGPSLSTAASPDIAESAVSFPHLFPDASLPQHAEKFTVHLMKRHEFWDRYPAERHS